jgi:GNAT superfamily N-acetyltransferase
MRRWRVSDATSASYPYDDRSIDYDDRSSYVPDVDTLPVSIRPPWSTGGVTIRCAQPADLAALEHLVDRCSDTALYRRFHGAAGPYVRREIARIAAPTPTHRSWVAADPGGVHGTATLAWGRSGTVEAAFLVEDAWRRRGIGSGLFAAVVHEARAAGVPTVAATVQADNEPALRFLRAVAPGARLRFAGGGEVDVELPVPPLAAVPMRWPLVGCGEAA